AIKADEILSLVKKAERLCSVLKAQGPKFVLCHSDIHAGNLLIDAKGSLFIIDWDHPVLAPKERDLMFIGGGVGSNWYRPQEEALFYKGYGRTEINHVALAYYRFERIVEDIAEWGERVLLTDEGGKDRARALQGFKRWFSPNDVVEMAYRAENSLPPELLSRLA
ncbi:MAG: Spectinomycin phosphotransferase, partial [Chloroflexi bacterium]|nr:Spectinomycin phosphotransferase [Chloroflexota bacterium]